LGLPNGSSSCHSIVLKTLAPFFSSILLLSCSSTRYASLAGMRTFPGHPSRSQSQKKLFSKVLCPRGFNISFSTPLQVHYLLLGYCSPQAWAFHACVP
jgi:hypothetical protein